MPKSKTTTSQRRGNSKAITTAIKRVLSSRTNSTIMKRRATAARRPRRRGQSTLQLNSLPAVMSGRVPRGFAGLSDLADFTVSYNPADIVLGGATVTTAPGNLGIAYWQPRGGATNSILSSGLLPIVMADSIIGRPYVADLLKHYTRRIITSVKVHLTSELSNTAQSGLFAITATRSGVDTAGCGSATSAALATNSDTDVMTMKGAKPFRVYDNCDYDATWAIAGGSGPLQNEFTINNADAGTTTVVSNLVDGLGVVPCCLYMGGSGSSAVAVSGTNVVTHRCIIEVRMHLLDYRGSIYNFNPLLSKKPIDPEEDYCVPPNTPKPPAPQQSSRSFSHK